MNPLISIIIPTYNRANLISETLDSVLCQTYQNWECIIVDDGSTDDTKKQVKAYLEKDNRFRYFERPANRLRGGNAARNVGFERCEGEYIIWFDSDDIMLEQHVEYKLKFLLKHHIDFVVAQTMNFTEKGGLKLHNYKKSEQGITASDYILRKINWLTYDVLVKREIAQQIQWNEKMRSWQDYNYFSKMLLLTEKGKYLEVVLTHRRLHENSIQNNLKSSKTSYLVELMSNKFLTFLDIQENLDYYTRKELLYYMMNLSYLLVGKRHFVPLINKIGELVKCHLGNKSMIYFYLSLQSVFLINKGQFLLEKAKKRGL